MNRSFLKGLAALTALFLFAVLGAVYGILLMEFRLPPYYHLAQAVRQLRGPDEPIATPEQYKRVDPRSLITVRSARLADEKRKALARFIWGTVNVPLEQPPRVREGWHGREFQIFSGLKSVDRIEMQLGSGLTSIAYHLVPLRSNRRLVILHAGHDQDANLMQEEINPLLSAGYSVVTMSMPLNGPNSRPNVLVPKFGSIELVSHEYLQFLPLKAGSPIRYFIDPVEQVVGLLAPRYRDVSMIGLSGGGWTTTLAAALDQRITRSYSVAGSYPLFLRFNSAKNWGDWEQTDVALYNVVDYLDLYVLSAHGTGRKAVQIFNRSDSCCFAGNWWKTYDAPVREAVRKTGSGAFQIVSVDNDEHSISPDTLEFIVRDMNADPPK